MSSDSVNRVRELCGLRDFAKEEEIVPLLDAATEQARLEAVCEKVMHLYVWTHEPDFYAVAQATNVPEARELLLEEIGGFDGSCPERVKAANLVREKTPAIWHRANAEFALTDSAELREQEDYSNKLQQRVKELEQELAALRAATKERE